MFAARVGDLESARALVAAGANVNVAGPDGPPLLVASASGQEAVAIFLLEKGADPNAVDGWGVSSLHWAVQEGLQVLSAARIGAPTDDAWYHKNMPALAKELLARGANPNAQIVHGTPDFNFPAFSHGGGITLPLIRQTGASPFLLAAASADVEMMRMLLSGGANPRLPTTEGVTPLMVASGLGLTRPRSEERSPAELQAVMLTLELGNEINASAAGSRTAVHGAAFIGANDIIEFLAGRGANLDAKDKYGQTPMSIALGDPERLTDPFDKRFRQQPRPKKQTADLLVKLGATPLDAEAIKVGAAKIARPSQYPAVQAGN
jgi:hypothetical protein